jgi:hypothetical protein
MSPEPITDAPGAAETSVNASQPGAGSGWTVRTVRPDPRVTLFDVQLSDYHEYFFVAVGEKSVSITMYDTSNPFYLEPQCFTFARPHDWDTDLGDDEALIQVWQAVGVQR